MTFRTHCKIVEGSIDPAPMVSVVFLLLIFLVLSSPFVTQPGFRVDLPKSNQAPDRSYQSLLVTVSRDNLMFFNNQSVSLRDFPQALKKAASETRNSELIISADRQVPHDTVVKIMSMAFEAGISAVNLATRPELSAPAAAR